MKKSVCSLFALVMIGFSVTGCSNKNPYIGTVDTDLKNIKADLVWWNDYAQTGSAAATQRYDYAQNVIKEFNKIYPNISVKQVEYASYSEIAKAVDNGLAGGNIPNIASTYPDNVLSWDTDGAILHAEQYFDDYKLGFGVSMDDKGTFIEDNSTVYADIQANIESEKAAYGSGDLLSLPYSRSSEALFINKIVFDKEGEGKCGQDSDHEVMAGQEEYVAPTANASKKKYSVPKDWKEMISLARQMKKDFSIFSDANQRDQDGWFINVPICYDSGDNLFISFSKMAGIDYADQEKPLFNNDAAKQMMIQLKKWNNEGLLCTADQLTWSRTAPQYHSYSTSMVNYGQVFMLVSSTTSGMYLGVDGYNIDVYPTPTFGTDDYDNPASNATSGKHYAISQGPSLALFENKDENTKKATFLFYKFLTNSQNSADLAATTGYFPIRKSSDNVSSYKKILDAADSDVPEHVTKTEDLTKKTDKYKGLSAKVNSQYVSAGDYFAAPVNKYSASTRSAVGELVNYVFNSTATTDAEIEKLVDDAFATAISSSIQ